MASSTNKTTKETVVTWIAATCVILGGMAAGLGLYITSREPGGFSLANLGNFGSYAQGTVASLWSLGALFFLYATLLAQRKQISQQEMQLKQQCLQFDTEQKRQKAEHEQQEKQFQSQQQAMQVQNFETSFFQLLQILSQIVGDLKDDRQVSVGLNETKTLKYERRECFMLWHIQLKEGFTDEKLERIADAKLPYNKEKEITLATSAPDKNIDRLVTESIPAQRTDERLIRVYYEEFYRERQESLGHYFRIIYHIVKFVDSANALKTYSEKRHYISLLRAQLSVYELFLIFYNGISVKSLNFKPLIEKYGLLEHLDRKLLLHELHSRFYNNNAYK